MHICKHIVWRVAVIRYDDAYNIAGQAPCFKIQHINLNHKIYVMYVLCTLYCSHPAQQPRHCQPFAFLKASIMRLMTNSVTHLPHSNSQGELRARNS